MVGRVGFFLVCFWTAYGFAHGDCPSRLAEHAIWEPLRLVASSLTEKSFSTVGVRGNSVFFLHDEIRRDGSAYLSAAQEHLIDFPEAPWGRILDVAVLASGNSRARGETLRASLAVVDTASKVYLVHGERALPVDLPSNEIPIQVSFSHTGLHRQLAIVTTAGICAVDLPKSFEGIDRLHADRFYSADGLRGGITLQPDEFVVFNKQGEVFKVSSLGKTPLGHLSQGIRSVGGYLEKGEPRLWIVDSAGTIWEKTPDTSIVPSKYEMGQGVQAMRIAAAAGPLTHDSLNPLKWGQGFLSRLKDSTSRGMERVLIVGDDGRLYSPWNYPRREISPMNPLELRLHASALLPGITFSRWITETLNTLPIGPIEVVARQKTLRAQGLSPDKADQLLAAWFRHHNFIRILKAKETGIAASLDAIGIPKSPGARLLFLDGIPDSLLEEIRNQTLRPNHLQKLGLYHQFFTQTGRELSQNLRKPVEGASDGMTLLAQIFELTRPVPLDDLERFATSLETEFADVPLYSALNRYLKAHDQGTYPFWEW